MYTAESLTHLAGLERQKLNNYLGILTTHLYRIKSKGNA